MILSCNLLALYSIWSLAAAAAAPGTSFHIETHRHEADRRAVDERSLHRQKQSGVLDSTLGKSLYWFGYFAVGDSGPLKLLIDTGSTDLILNPGLYKLSSRSKPYGTGHFLTKYEGVNGTTTRDRVTAGGLTVDDQPIGQTNTTMYFDVQKPSHPHQGQGIMGFSGPSQSAFHPKSNSWFWNLCAEKKLKACKLGLVFGTNGKGLSVIGELAHKYLKGDLVTVPNVVGYATQADVTLDNKIILENQTTIMDVGTDNIQGPYDATKKILKQLGYQLHEATGPNKFDPKVPVKVVTGDFACDKPPVLGFSFPAQAYLKPGQKSRIFNVSPDVLGVFDHGHNNCTSILGGTNAVEHIAPKLWLLGQPFFAGHYVDFDITKNTVGYGDLKNPSDPKN